MDVETTRVVPFKRAMLLIWAAVATCIWIYVRLAYMVQSKGMVRANSPVAAWLYNPGLVIIPVAVLIVSLAVDRIALSSGAPASEISRNGRSPESRPRMLYVVQMALCESVALVGLVHFFLGGTLAHLVHSCLISFVLMGILLLKLPLYVAAAGRAAQGAPSTDPL